MEYMDLGIIVLAALMVWLLYKVTQETRAYTTTQQRYVLREARSEAPHDRLAGGTRPRR
jgi:hypothetical protein